jgi:hypothetical protein
MAKIFSGQDTSHQDWEGVLQRFLKDVDWEGNGLPGQFRRRIEGFYLEPTECCIESGCAFAAGLLLVSCIDSLARLKYRRFDRNDVSGRFKDLLKELPAFGAGNFRQRFYDDIRNGLVHEARLKNGAQFTLDSTADKAVTEGAGSILLVNPSHLLTQVRKALNDYIRLLEADEHERCLLSASLMLDLEKDFRVAEQYGA